jgi:uncharacterized protein (DUF2252 family)
MTDSLANSNSDMRASKVRADLILWNEGIDREERQSKLCKLATSPLAFCRGTNHLFWSDFSGDKRLGYFGSEKTKTWLQGDLHVYNFGSYDNAKGEVVYDLNDFDDAIIADYQYDVWRMAVSIVLVAYQNADLSIGQQKMVLDSFSQSYLDTMEAYRNSKNNNLGDATKHSTYGKLKQFLSSIEGQYSREGMLDRWAPKNKGKRHFDLSRGKLGEVTETERLMILKAIPAYQHTLSKGMAKKDTYFKVEDIARRLNAGIGSLGMNRYYILIAGDKDGDPDKCRILDVKYQSKPTAYTFLGDETQREYNDGFRNDAQRCMQAYQALTQHTDKYLGWMHLESNDVGFLSGYYLVRERSPYKEAFPCEALDTRASFSALCEQWGEILAASHTRANKDLPRSLLQLVGNQNEAFRNLVREIAFRYADQVKSDWKSFVASSDLFVEECKEQYFVPSSYRDLLPH